MSTLIKLQDCDLKIKEITHKKMEGPLKIQTLEEELNAIELKGQADIEKLESFKKERRQREQEIQELDNRIEKSKIKLSNVKSNKEYTAALKEIDEQEKSKVLLEDEVIRLMEEIEDLENKCSQNKDHQRAMNEKFKETKREVEQELQNLDQRLKNLEIERRKFDQAVDQELLKRYLFLRERKGGVAVSAVVDGVCQTCHMGLPPQKFNELQRGNLMMNCPHCQRMIYWGDSDDFKNVLDEV